MGPMGKPQSQGQSLPRHPQQRRHRWRYLQRNRRQGGDLGGFRGKRFRVEGWEGWFRISGVWGVGRGRHAIPVDVHMRIVDCRS